MYELTHASFFSGVAGVDMGLERAGWRTVSFSEIDPYASAVLAQRWPDVPNLGDIAALAERVVGLRPQLEPGPGTAPDAVATPEGGDGQRDLGPSGDDWQHATLWTGGFPCQDLSIAGKRRGFTHDDLSTRSGLAFAFLQLVAVYRPPYIVLENVPGLLSSHDGRDMATLLGAMVELGYGVGYRILDARFFGVPQRRRRVLIVGDRTGGHPGAERAAEVLSVGSRCGWHPPKGLKKGKVATGGPRTGLEIAGALTRRYGKGVNTTLDDGALVIGTLREHVRPGSNTDHVVVTGAADDAGGQGRGRQGPADLGGHEPDPGDIADADAVLGVAGAPADAGGDGAPDGLAGRPHHRDGLDTPSTWIKGGRAQTSESPESWRADDVVPTINGFDVGDTRATALVGTVITSDDDPLLPLGLDSHRYRCCGNGVVSQVAEFIGERLAAEARR